MTDEEKKEIIDVLLERPKQLTIADRMFKISPLSLGKTLLLSKYIGMLDFTIDDKNVLLSLISVCKKDRDVVATIIAIYITDDCNKILDSQYICSLSDFVKTNLETTELATLLHLYFDLPTTAKLAKSLGIDKEKQRIAKIIRAKDNDNAVRVGGVSLLGSLIDVACERYGWTYQYVLWGISYDVLQLMMADISQSIYLTDKERSRVRVPLDGIILSGDKKEDVETIKNLIQ